MANKDNPNNYYSIYNAANFSTSKITILVTYIIAYTWGVGMFYMSIICCLKLKYVDFNVCCYIVLTLISMILPYFFIKLLTFLGIKYLKSNIDHFEDLKIEQKPFENINPIESQQNQSNI